MVELCKELLGVKKKSKFLTGFYCLRETSTNKQLFLALISTNGLKRNTWSEDLVDEVVSLEDLF